MTASIDDYVERMNTHQRNAKELQRAHTTPVPDDDGVIMQWDSPQHLRLVMHEHELAQECMQAMFECGAIRTLAMMKAYAHRCYCLARKVTKIVSELVARSLAEIADLFSNRVALGSAPPRQLVAVPVLATCHASNAPSLSPVAMNHWQERPPK